jgi:hypothetical protein
MFCRHLHLHAATYSHVTRINLLLSAGTLKACLYINVQKLSYVLTVLNLFASLSGIDFYSH